MSVPDKVDGANRWSLDHLFVDQDAIPTLVEVKQSKNTEIRRQIVGQLMDYAANGSEYWTIGQIREEFARTCLKANIQESQLFRQFLEDVNEETTEHVLLERVQGFWDSVAANLKSGNLRLLFVADVIPYELRRIIEFLNNQMRPARVMGVEIRQYKGFNMTAFVPRVFPQQVMNQKPPRETSQARGSASDVVPTLIASGRIPLGSRLRFRPERGNKAAIEEWMKSQPRDVLEAEWCADPNRTLKWLKDGRALFGHRTV